MDGSVFYFSVVAGGVALYSIDFQLNEVEIETYSERGNVYLEELAESVRNDFASFRTRGMERFTTLLEIDKAVRNWRDGSRQTI